LLVALTPEGEAAVAIARATRERLLQQIFGALDETDRTTMARLLDALDAAVAAISPDHAGTGPARVA
jgi:DNA-binding MarR family transcriptional regulator